MGTSHQLDARVVTLLGQGLCLLEQRLLGALASVTDDLPLRQASLVAPFVLLFDSSLARTVNPCFLIGEVLGRLLAQLFGPALFALDTVLTLFAERQPGLEQQAPQQDDHE